MVVPLLLLSAASAFDVGGGAEDKGYVVDGALKVASGVLKGKKMLDLLEYVPFNKSFGERTILFTLELKGKLQVQGLSRQGNVSYHYDELPEAKARFGFHGLINTTFDGTYSLSNVGSLVSSGDAQVHWDIGFKSTLATKDCDFVLASALEMGGSTFRIDTVSEDKHLSVSYFEDTHKDRTPELKRRVSEIVSGALLEIPICEAIDC